MLQSDNLKSRLRLFIIAPTLFSMSSIIIAFLYCLNQYQEQDIRNDHELIKATVYDEVRYYLETGSSEEINLTLHNLIEMPTIHAIRIISLKDGNLNKEVFSSEYSKGEITVLPHEFSISALKFDSAPEEIPNTIGSVSIYYKTNPYHEIRLHFVYLVFSVSAIAFILSLMICRSFSRKTLSSINSIISMNNTTNKKTMEVNLSELQSVREKVYDLINSCDQKEDQLSKARDDLIDCYETIGHLLSEIEDQQKAFQAFKIHVKTKIFPPATLISTTLESIHSHEKKSSSNTINFKLKAIENAIHNINSIICESQNIINQERTAPPPNDLLDLYKATTELLENSAHLGKVLDKPVQHINHVSDDSFLVNSSVFKLISNKVLSHVFDECDHKGFQVTLNTKSEDSNKMFIMRYQYHLSRATEPEMMSDLENKKKSALSALRLHSLRKIVKENKGVLESSCGEIKIEIPIIPSDTTQTPSNNKNIVSFSKR